MNNVTLTGRLTKDMDLRYTQSGMGFARFILAVDKNLSKEKRAEFESNNKPTANFISCVAWGKVAENMANYLGKGSLIALTGEIETGSYQDKNGETRYTTDVRATRVEFLQSKNNNGGNQNNNQQQNNGGFQNQNQQGFADDEEGFFPVDMNDIPF